MTTLLILGMVLMVLCGATKLASRIALWAVKYLAWFFGLMFVLWAIGTYMYA